MRQAQRYGPSEAAATVGERPLPAEYPSTKPKPGSDLNSSELKRKPLIPSSQLRAGQQDHGQSKQPRTRPRGLMQREEPAGPSGTSSHGRVSDLLAQRRDPAGGGSASQPGRPAGLDLTRLPGTNLDLPSARNWAGPPTSRSTAATTFADVANVDNEGGDEPPAAMDLDNLQILTRAHGPPAGAAPTPRGVEDVEVDVVPCDWSLKRRITFVSPRPFSLQDGIVQGQVLSTHDSGQAMLNRAGGREPGLMATPEAQLLQGLTTWQHPEMELPAVAVEAMRGDRMGQQCLAQRQVAWQEAFSSLFHMLRNGQVSCFYYIVNPASGSREARFSVLFRTVAGAGVGGGPALVAMVTRSTRGLRTVLRREGVQFAMPLAGWQAGAEGEDLDELEEYKRAGGATRAVDGEAKVDGKPESLLVVDDPRDVMGLYEFLLNYRLGGSSDVPSLLAPTAFRNGAMQTLRVAYTRATAAEADGGARGGGGTGGYGTGRQRYRAVCQGMIPPWVAWRACRAFSAAQEGELEVQMVTDPDSSRLNLPSVGGGGRSGGDGLVARGGKEGRGGWMEAGLAADSVLTGLTALPGGRFLARVMRNLPA